MKNTRLIAFLIIISLGLIVHAQTGESYKIKTGPGPEDIVIDFYDDIPKLLISTSSRRDGYGEYSEIELYDPDTGKVKVLPRINEPRDLSFKPHGIYLIQIDNQKLLYVLLHDDVKKEHPVVRYVYQDELLIFDRIFQNELLISPNAITVFDDGSFLVCNDAAKRGNKIEQILGLKSGNILFFDKAGNVNKVADKLGMPAGMNRIGKKIFVSCATENKIFSFDFRNKQLQNKSLLTRIKGPDNIRVSEGTLYVANHPKMLKFIKHIKNAKNLSPSSIFTIDPSSGNKHNIFLNSGEKISAVSVAIPHKNSLYIGQIFENYILKVENQSIKNPG